jgi:hypothetical protein
MELVERGLIPTFNGIMLSNAFDRCPAASPTRIRPPSKAELNSNENQTRVLGELRAAQARGCRTIIALGKVAGDMLGHLTKAELSQADQPKMEVIVRPHPSALGLMQSNRHRAPGYKLVELEDDWVNTTVAIIRSVLARAQDRATTTTIV